MAFLRWLAGFVTEGEPQSSVRLLAVIAALAIAGVVVVMCVVVVRWVHNADGLDRLSHLVYILGPLIGVALALRGRGKQPPPPPPEHE